MRNLARLGVALGILAGTLVLLPSTFAAADEPSRRGLPYVDDELRMPAPGPEWLMQEEVPDAPSLAGAFMLVRGDKASLVAFSVDATPSTSDPALYVQRGFETLTKPPLSFKPLRKAPFKWKEQQAFRVEYTDSEGKRHFAQAAIKTPRGGILVVTLQSPNAATYKQDLPVYVAFLNRIELTGPKAATPSRP